MPILIVDPLEWEGIPKDEKYPRDAGNWLREALNLHPQDVQYWRIQQCELPPPGEWQGIVIGGSISSVYDEDAWIDTLCHYTRNWINEKKAILGVCFGHQILAHVMGGVVEKNPKGWELGTCAIRCTQEGLHSPLFAGCPQTFSVMQSHEDIVTQAPENVRILAESDHCAIQALQYAPNIFSIQYHPEFTQADMEFILNIYKDDFADEGINVAPLLETLSPCPESKIVMRNFLHFLNENSA